MNHAHYFTKNFEAATGIDFSAYGLLLAHAGSRGYNTATEDSDYDFSGVVVPPTKRLLGLDPFDGWEPKKGTLEHDVDGKVHSIAKTIRLLLKGNPNMLEVLWLPSSAYVFTTPVGNMLIAKRGLFSSKHAYESLAKYADAQFKVMLRGTEEDRKEWDAAVAMILAAGWTVKQIVKKAPRDMPNYDRVEVMYIMARWGEERLRDAGRSRIAHPLLDMVLDDAVRTIRKLQYRQFRSGLGEARKQMVLAHGYDPKNASHLIRLLYLGRDFARHGELFPFMVGAARNNVIDIKTGQWELERVKDLATSLWEQCEQAFKTTSLPDHPDRNGAEELLIDIQRRAII